MLQFIRTYAGSWVVKILFVLLIVSFAAWGIGDMIRTGGISSTVASVGKVEIDRAELDQEFRRQMERLRPMVGGNLTTEQARQFGLLDQSLSALVQRALYDQAARDAGISVGPDVVRQRIAEEPAFRNAQNQFDPNQFRSVLRNNQLTEDGYVALLRRETARELVAGAVGAGVTPPKLLVQDLYRFRGERRVAEVVTLPNAAIGDVGVPDEAELTRYYEDHQVRFTAPEYRALSIAQLSADEIAKDIEIPDAELRAAYDERADELGTPERRTVEMVLADDEAKAKQIAEAAKTKGLTAAAKDAGTDVITLDNVTRNELPEIGDAAFALAQGAVSDAVRSGLGWHVLTVTAIQPGATKSFEEARDQLLAELRKEKAMDSLYSIANRVEDQLASGAPLEEVAQAQSLPIAKIAAVDSSGKAPDGKDAAPGRPNFAAMVQTAFQLASGATSNLTEAPNNVFYAVRVDGVTPAAPKPLAEVRDQAVAGWQDDKRAKLAAEKAQDIAAKLKQGSEAAAQDVAGQSGASFAMTTPFTRDARSVEGLPGELVRKLFEVKPGETVTGATADSQVVARLKEIIPADPAASDATLATVESTVAQGLESDIMAQFGNALRDRYPVEVHRNRIDQFFASGN
ncbi:peptidylprolyl isomerase [Azospirillum formosense]|uniref:Parvulin-like PPIase n=1 Tax=Azospirillum formosense TaxID=861533 RepID=A0ABX2KXU7_9PROT|nr:SurA N-terminal domain-containing protein [Azospirillum formosense]MBY3752826.1 peptidylprolyl isomerase [Azospirillum formosense]NUB20554.1 peptidylprolyl isomerase [Azospirillum formosense]